MKFYLDSANLNEIEEAKQLIYFAGVTTNPLLINREMIQNRFRLYNEILRLIPKKELFIQVYSIEPAEVYAEALDLAQLSHERIIIKIPLKNEFLSVASRLSNKSVRVCLTAISSARQILIAESTGVEFAAIYLNRLLKSGIDGYREITIAHNALNMTRSNFRILVASLPDEKLIDPLLELHRLDFTLPFTPFSKIAFSIETSKWVREFDEITNKASK